MEKNWTTDKEPAAGSWYSTCITAVSLTYSWPQSLLYNTYIQILLSLAFPKTRSPPRPEGYRECFFFAGMFQSISSLYFNSAPLQHRCGFLQLARVFKRKNRYPFDMITQHYAIRWMDSVIHPLNYDLVQLLRDLPRLALVSRGSTSAQKGGREEQSEYGSFLARIRGRGRNKGW